MALPPESHRLRPDHLPTPFSATQIRAGCPTGRRIWLQTVVPGHEPTYRQIRFLRTDETGATQEFQSTDATGQPLGEAVQRQSTWLDLQGHASQPADRASLAEVERSLIWGAEPCWRYIVRGDDDTEARLWFAQRRPGMPMVVEEWRGDELLERSEVMTDEMARQAS